MSRVLMFASPSLHDHSANFVFYNNIGGCSFSFKTSKLAAVRNTYSCAPLVLWRGREKERREKKRKILLSIQAMDDSSNASTQHTLQEITSQEKLEIEELQEKVWKMFVEIPDNSTQKLVFIDRMQRLGVAYLFHNDIEASIKNIFDVSQQSENNDDNLYIVALRFRLVRQQGLYMPSDVFEKFTIHDRRFIKETAYDVQGLLSLYEASHLRVHGEEILEEALIFTTTHLKSMVPNLSNSLKIHVNEALSQPIHKTVPRVGARKYIRIFENSEDPNDLLLQFAKLDFNRLQKLYQEELNELASWWNELDFANKLPFVAKQKLVEGYFWTVGVCPEPRYSRVRTMLTKVVKINTIIDDIYDSYATLEELELFTGAIQRWDIGVMGSLPPYMQTVYRALLDIYNEIEEVLTKEGKSDNIYYAKEEMKKLVSAYFKEAKWLSAGYTPTCEEFMKNIGFLTSTIPLYVITALVTMEEFVRKDIFEWLTNEPLICRAPSTIGRLSDDIVDYKIYQERGDNASFVECYIKEYGASKEEAYVEIGKEITTAWKDINKEFLNHKGIPVFVLELPLNFARLVDTFFADGRDGYTNPKSKIKDLLTLLFVESV